MPAPLAAIGLKNTPFAYDILLKAALVTIRVTGTDPKHLDAEAGMVAHMRHPLSFRLAPRTKSEMRSSQGQLSGAIQTVRLGLAMTAGEQNGSSRRARGCHVRIRIDFDS
jgi:hypothetical protein